jgi:hypothetical protein
MKTKRCATPSGLPSQISLRLTASQRSKLGRLAYSEERSIGCVIRRIIDAALASSSDSCS